METTLFKDATNREKGLKGLIMTYNGLAANAASLSSVEVIQEPPSLVCYLGWLLEEEYLEKFPIIINVYQPNKSSCRSLQNIVGCCRPASLIGITLLGREIFYAPTIHLVGCPSRTGPPLPPTLPGVIEYTPFTLPSFVDSIYVRSIQMGEPRITPRDVAKLLKPIIADHNEKPYTSRRNCETFAAAVCSALVGHNSLRTFVLRAPKIPPIHATVPRTAEIAAATELCLAAKQGVPPGHDASLLNPLPLGGDELHQEEYSSCSSLLGEILSEADEPPPSRPVAQTGEKVLERVVMFLGESESSSSEGPLMVHDTYAADRPIPAGKRRAQQKGGASQNLWGNIKGYDLI